MSTLDSELLARADAAWAQFRTKIPAGERELTRESHRIAFRAGYVFACQQNQWRGASPPDNPPAQPQVTQPLDSGAASSKPPGPV